MSQKQAIVTTLTPAHLTLIDALAHRDVEDYLREQAALRNACEPDRPDRVALRSDSKAA